MVGPPWPWDRLTNNPAQVIGQRIPIFPHVRLKARRQLIEDATESVDVGSTIDLRTSALLECSMGSSPAPLTVTSNLVLKVKGKLAATVMDFAPTANIQPFGMCKSLGNPTVAAATSAAQGTLTPMPCVPATVAPWVPPAVQTMIGGYPGLLNSAKCTCSLGGIVSVQQTGQEVPTLRDQ